MTSRPPVMSPLISSGMWRIPSGWRCVPSRWRRIPSRWRWISWVIPSRRTTMLKSRVSLHVLCGRIIWVSTRWWSRGVGWVPHVFFIFTLWHRRVRVGWVAEEVSRRGSYVIRSYTVRIWVLGSIFWSIIYNNPEIN